MPPENAAGRIPARYVPSQEEQIEIIRRRIQYAPMEHGVDIIGTTFKGGGLTGTPAQQFQECTDDGRLATATAGSGNHESWQVRYRHDELLSPPGTGS